MYSMKCGFFYSPCRDKLYLLYKIVFSSLIYDVLLYTKVSCISRPLSGFLVLFLDQYRSFMVCVCEIIITSALF